MARSRISSDEAFSKARTPSRSRRKLGKLRLLGFALLLFLVGLFFAIPMVASNASLVNSIVNKYAGLDPLRVHVDQVSIGWFSPFQARRISIMDERGSELLQVGEVETQLSIWNLATNYSNLRNIYIRQTRLAIDVQPNTTSLEEALQPLLAKWFPVTSEPAATIETTSSAATEFSGTIQIEDATVLARDSVSGAQWEFGISNAVVPLPTAEAPVPAIEVVGRIAQVDSSEKLILRSTGQFEAKLEAIESSSSLIAAKTTTADQRLHLKISTGGMPLEWIALVKRRLPDLPVDQLSGTATVQMEIDVDSLDKLSAKISTAQVENLHITADQILGARGANFNQIRLTGNLNWNGGTLQTDQMQLTSDVGYLRADARSKIPPAMPSLIKPWMDGAEFAIDGEIDLARLTQIAPDLIAMRDNARLTSGKATLSLRQTPSSNVGGMPNVVCNIRLGSLLAEFQGSKMQWDDALELKAQVLPNAESQAAEFQVNCAAEFCDINGKGTLNQGQLTATIDLDKLEKRVSQWINLPMESLAGSASANVIWQQQDADRVVANATINSSPISIVLPAGHLNEPAWKGEAMAALRIDGLQIVQIDRASAKLSTANELIDVAMSAPLRIAAMPAGSPSVPPTNATATVKTDLAACINRTKILAGFDPGVSLAGFCDMQVDLMVDNMQPVIKAATYDFNGLTVRGDGYSINENHVQGKFRGDINAMNIAATRVEEMIVQAESFALSARDTAADQAGYIRNGQAAFRIDPSRLMKSVAFDGPAQPSTMLYSGDLTGQLQWLLGSDKVDWQLRMDGKDISIDQLPTNSQLPTTLVSTTSIANTAAATNIWQEPQLKADVRGTYVFADGAVNIPSATIQSEWMAYVGSTNYTSNATGMLVDCNGQLTYDMQAVVAKLKPWVGDYASASGQKSEPIQFSWRSNNNGSGSWADSLAARTSIGWDQGNVIGIVLGPANVPMNVQNGLLTTTAEIPVSQGTVRWDLTSNLASDKMAIVQKPQTVLENVAITPQMCQSWLKYVAPIVANVASIQGTLSMEIERAEILPFDLMNQTVAGKLYVHNATVGPGPLSDQLIGIVRQINAIKKGASLDPNGVNNDLWVKMPEQKIAFTVEQGMISHKDLQMNVGDVVIKTSGGARLDGTLQMLASVPVQEDWIKSNQYLASLAGKTIDVPIGGTLQQPRVDFSGMTSIISQLGITAAQGEVQTQLNKGLNKVLGPLQNQLQPLQQQIQSLPSQLPQLPQFPNFGLPGFGGNK